MKIRFFNDNYLLSESKDQLFSADTILGDDSFGSEVYAIPENGYFILLAEKSIKEVYQKFGENIEKFKENIFASTISVNDQVLNVPFCILRTGNLGNLAGESFFHNRKDYLYNTLFSKIPKCLQCVYQNKCKGIHIVFLKAYGNAILNPIKSESMSVYNYIPYFSVKLSDFNGTPPKIDHYSYIYNFIINNFDKNSSILEIGAYYGLFIDFLTKSGYINVKGIEKIRKNVEFAYDHGLKSLSHIDFYKDLVNDFIGQDLIIILGVFHNDYTFMEYGNISLENYCINILSKSYMLLNEGGKIIFTANRFNFDIPKIEQIGYKNIDFFMEKGSNGLYYYIAEK